ncbi:hypothetical protein [Sphingomicrobium aestuariivivum]|uniref:hypothetical protein n=1 Tax=Sphingomicrobium aestuariivivum TaxID=1582356 RepID=UPI001FD6527B|nr:hypothetical protein [Sphingomicrobium aestuariivivum]MCJ8190625.1 hypothetical protein [Sphingomicrobium aestuariivivum]
MKKIALALAGSAFLATPAAALAAPPAHAGGAKHQMHGASYAQPACPPGLAKKRNGCMPPGQAKKYERGHRFDRSFSGYTAYDRIPYDLRRHYDLDPRSRYIYDNDYIYRVDPTTLVVREVLRAIL